MVPLIIGGAALLLAIEASDSEKPVKPKRKSRPRWMFHASPVENRLSIREDGLEPGYDASYGPPAVYLFRDAFLAENYRSGEPFDVWAVNVAGIRIHPDPEDPAGAVYVDEDHEIGPDRVEHRGTFFDGDLVEVSDELASSDNIPVGSEWAEYFSKKRNNQKK